MDGKDFVEMDVCMRRQGKNGNGDTFGKKGILFVICLWGNRRKAE